MPAKVTPAVKEREYRDGAAELWLLRIDFGFQHASVSLPVSSTTMNSKSGPYMPAAADGAVRRAMHWPGRGAREAGLERRRYLGD
mmetsp:Transcript_22594/g.73065  ORF Transcript_22594/g.73065 Transcript_22594/m.73065 type:complete len:85 (+) Transcript_22594:230-484(+)